MSPQEFCDRYDDYLKVLGVSAGGDCAASVNTTREALELSELDIVIGQIKVYFGKVSVKLPVLTDALKVFLGHEAFHKMETTFEQTMPRNKKGTDFARQSSRRVSTLSGCVCPLFNWHRRRRSFSRPGIQQPVPLFDAAASSGSKCG